MAHRIVIYGSDMEQLQNLKKLRDAPGQLIITRDLRMFKPGDIEDVHEVILASASPEIFKAYEARKIPVSLLDNEPKNKATGAVDPKLQAKIATETGGVVRPTTSTELEERARKEAEEARAKDIFVGVETADLKAHLKKVTGRTPADIMPRERVEELLRESGVTQWPPAEPKKD